MAKLDATKNSYWEMGPFGWVGDPAGENTGEANATIKARRFDLNIIGGVVDADASYEYDEFALVELDGKYYLLQTSGCSCPSPSETWGVNLGPATLDEVREHITGGLYAGYTLPAKKQAEFLALIEEAKTAAP